MRNSLEVCSRHDIAFSDPKKGCPCCDLESQLDEAEVRIANLKDDISDREKERDDWKFAYEELYNKLETRAALIAEKLEQPKNGK